MLVGLGVERKGSLQHLLQQGKLAVPFSRRWTSNHCTELNYRVQLLEFQELQREPARFCSCVSYESKSSSSSALLRRASPGLGPPHSHKPHLGTKGRTARLGRPLERQGRVLRSTAYATSRRPEAAAGRRVQRALDGLARREAGELVVPR